MVTGQAVSGKQAFEMATACFEQGDYAKARQLLGLILQHRPDNSRCLHMLALISDAEQKSLEAEALFQKAVLSAPTDGDLLINYGVFLVRHQKSAQATELLEQVAKETALLEVFIRAVDALTTFAPSLSLELVGTRLQSQWRDAFSFRRLQAKVLNRNSDFTTAFEIASTLVSEQPDDLDSWSQLAVSALRLGTYGAYVEQHVKAYLASPDVRHVQKLLLGLCMLPEYDNPKLLQVCKAAVAVTPKAFLQHEPPKFRAYAPDRPLRIAFVSAEGPASPLGQLQVLPLCRELCRLEGVEFALVDVRPGEPIFKEDWDAAGIHVVQAAGLSEAELAKRLLELDLDVIIDNAGYSVTPACFMSRYRLAPVQFTAYFAPLGTENLDAFIYSPDLCTTVTSGLLGAPAEPCLPAYAPSEFSKVASRHRPKKPKLPIVYGSFNSCSKISDLSISLWSRVLDRVPGSRILVKGAGLQNEKTQAHLKKRLRDYGIAPERVQLLGFLEKSAYREIHNQVDVLLDTYPFSGATTNLEALHLGVPVVTMMGNLPVSRMGGSINRILGLDALVAENEAEYIEIAVRLGTDHDALERLRDQIVTLWDDTVLSDAKGWAKSVHTIAKSYLEKYHAQ